MNIGCRAQREGSGEEGGEDGVPSGAVVVVVEVAEPLVLDFQDALPEVPVGNGPVEKAGDLLRIFFREQDPRPVQGLGHRGRRVGQDRDAVEEGLHQGDAEALVLAQGNVGDTPSKIGGEGFRCPGFIRRTGAIAGSGRMSGLQADLDTNRTKATAGARIAARRNSRAEQYENLAKAVQLI